MTTSVTNRAQPQSRVIRRPNGVAQTETQFKLAKTQDALAWCLTILEHEGIAYNPAYAALVKR